MAQTGYTAIQLYYTTTVSATPTAGNLAAGELAINTADEKLYFKNSSGVVKLLASTLMVGTNGGTGVDNGSRTLSYAGNVAFTGAFNPTFAIPSSSTYTFPTGDSTLVATTGTVANATNATTAATATAANGLKTATTTVSISASTAPTSGQVLVASSTTLAAWATPTVTLNSVTAAGGSATIASGNNPIVWNWAQTTASQTAFTIGETSASTNGTTAQDLVQIATLALSTANPLRVKARGADVILIGNAGNVTVTGITSSFGGSTSATLAGGTVALTGTSLSTTLSSTVSVKSGNASTAVFGSVGTSGATGAVTIASGDSSSNVSGSVTVSSGTAAGNSGALTLSTGTAAINSGAVTISTGGGTVYDTGGISIKTGNTSSSGASGGLTLETGSSTSSASGDIQIKIGTAGGTKGKVNFVNVTTANGSVATTITSLGPAGAATTIQGWLAIKVDGTARYVPYW